MPDALTLTVREVTAPTPTARRLVLSLGDVPFSYQAGQGAALGLHGQRERRPYSIASAPADSSIDGAIEFLLRALPGGGLGRHLDGVREGSRVDFEGPFGAFVLPDDLPDTPLLFLAGGTGVAPLRSLAREARARGHRGPRHLLYSVREASDVAYAEELARWHEDHHGIATITATRHAPPSWPGERGRIDLPMLGRFTADDPLCFVCGPPGMVDDLTHALSQLGVPGDHVRMEQWAPTV